MFGTVQQDQYLSNARVRNITTAGKLSSTVSTGGIYNNLNYTVVSVFLNNAIAPVTYNLTVANNPGQMPGDIKMYLFTIAAALGQEPQFPCVVNLPDNVYSSFQDINFESPGYGRQLIFNNYKQVSLGLIFDGQVWINTFEYG